MFENLLNQTQKNLLRHTLGASSHHKKKDWGFRNYFNTDGENDPDYKTLVGLVDHGCMVQKGNNFFATKFGALSIGFKSYQLKGIKFPKGKLDKITISKARSITGFTITPYEEYNGGECFCCKRSLNRNNAENIKKISYEYDEFEYACNKCLIIRAQVIESNFDILIV